jgi:hypothetical protein
MIKFKTTKLYIVLSFFLTINTHALVVSDPTSYSYYVEQLKKFTQQIELAKKTLNENMQLTTDFQKYADELRQQYNFADNIIGDLEQQFTSFEKYKNSLTPKQLKDFNFNRKYDLKDLEDVIDTNLDGIFIDPTADEYNKLTISKMRNLERQRLIKEALTTSKRNLITIDKNINRSVELAKQSNQTKNTKEALDINNALLVEILSALNTLVEVTSTLGQAEMASKFVSYSKDAHELELKAFKAKYPNGYKKGSKITGYQYWETKEDYFAHLKKCKDYRKLHGHTNTTIDGYYCPGKLTKISQQYWKDYRAKKKAELEAKRNKTYNPNKNYDPNDPFNPQK